MGTHLRPLFLLALPCLIACAGSGQPGGGASGGTTGSGGSGGGPGSGGTPAGTGGGSGGAPGSGGTPSTPGTGGVTATGGAPATGGSPPATPDAASDGAPASDAPAAAGMRASEGCGKGLPAPAEGFHTLKVNGMDRRFFLRLPPTYDGKTPWPVIVGLHGAGNKDGSWFDKSTGMRAANQATSVLIFGESLFRPGSTSERSWQDEGQLPANLAYIDATVAWAKANLCIDPARLFAAGQSSGAYFAQTLACHRGDVFRAVASSDGGERLFMNCKGNPSAFVRFRPAGLNAPDSLRALDFWSKRNTCGAKTEPTNVPPCQAITGCANDVLLWKCSDGGAHDWPAYMDKGVGTFFALFK